MLRVKLADLRVPAKVRNNIVGFTPEQLRMPAQEDRTDQKTGHVIHKIFKSIVFPKPGYAFSRPGTPFRPSAWSHGGISIQEMMIPMVVMEVRSEDTGLFSLESVRGPGETVEGEFVEFSVRIKPKSQKPADELRVDVEAVCGKGDIRHALRDQVVFVPANGERVVWSFKPDTESATPDERRLGEMERTLTIKASCREKGKIFQRTETCAFTVKLNSDKIVRRVPAHLGNILGLTPKSMR